MWIEPAGFEQTHQRGNVEAHRLQDPSKWVPFGVGAIEGRAGRPLAVLEAGPDEEGPGDQAGASTAKPEYGAGEEPRPRDGEPTGSAHGELL